eukprot:scaffold12458_cov132-Isochrysis_galbana.AAC.2
MVGRTLYGLLRHRWRRCAASAHCVRRMGVNLTYAPGNSLLGAGGRGQGGETLWANRIRTCRSAGQSNAMKPSPQLCLKAGETACSSK